jgi:ATP-dependent Clp protease protease subunit
VELGFADRLAEPVRIAARFDVGQFRNAPPVLVEAVEPAATEADGDAAVDSDAVTDHVPDADADPAADAEGAPIAAATVPATPISEAPDPAAIRAEALAHASAVIDLCALAGLPLQARRFLESGATLDEVRAALLAARADATTEVTALHPQPGHPSVAQPWGEVIARTFRTKG